MVLMHENAGLSNLNQPRAANCQLSLVTGHKSVANHTNVNRPRPVSLYHYQSGEKERKKKTKQTNKTKQKNTNCRILNQNITI